jgi:hypothetical protein
MSELEDLLNGKTKENKTESLDDKSTVETNDEVVKKEQQLQNLNKAIAEANIILKTKRKEAKNQSEEDDIPKINMEDPSSKAWDRHISDKVNPVMETLEREKEEIRTYALKQFLSDKPALASDPNKLKSLLDTYKSLSDGKISEKTSEGVLIYLDKAYAAENFEELNQQSRERRIAKARADAIYSDSAVSRGATGYVEQREVTPHLSEDDRAILAKWGMSPADYIALKKKYPKQ